MELPGRTQGKLEMKTKNNSLGEIAGELKKAKRVVIFPHMNVDGDAMGTASSICLGLRSLGVDSYVYLDESVPNNLDFLEAGCSTGDPDIVDGDTTVLMVDCSSVSRIGRRKEAFQRGGRSVCIDHHSMGEGDTTFDMDHIEPDSAACSELAYLLLKEMGVELDLAMANCLFAGISTDSGNFQYSNTTARTHIIAAELFDVPGFDPKVVSSLVYERNSFSSMKMSSLVVERARFMCGGKLVYGEIAMADLEETGAHMNETDGIIQRLMSIDGVEAAVIFKETKPDLVKVSMRARSWLNVGDVAQRLGGGGHVRAAGCSLKMALDQAEPVVLDELKKQMEIDSQERF